MYKVKIKFMFLEKVEKEKVDFKNITDVIKSDKKIIKYRSLLNIIKTIHILFINKKQKQRS